MTPESDMADKENENGKTEDTKPALEQNTDDNELFYELLAEMRI